MSFVSVWIVVLLLKLNNDNKRNLHLFSIGVNKRNWNICLFFLQIIEFKKYHFCYVTVEEYWIGKMVHYFLNLNEEISQRKDFTIFSFLTWKNNF